MNSLSRDLCMLSEAVYLPTWEEVEKAIAPDWQLSAPLDIADSEAMVCRMGEHATALVFRGTEFSRGSLTDIAANFGSLRAWDGPGRMHSGYWQQLTTIYEAARAAAGMLAGAPLYLTGHSMGGAVATLFGAKNAYSGDGAIHIDGIETFGAPKCMDAEAAGWYPVALKRHVVRGDFAPYWPLKSSFAHPAYEPIRWDAPPGVFTPFMRHDISRSYRRAVG